MSFRRAEEDEEGGTLDGFPFQAIHFRFNLNPEMR